MEKKNNELPKQLIEALRSAIETIVEQILEEKRRQDPHALDDIVTGLAADRQSFIERSIKK